MPQSYTLKSCLEYGLQNNYSLRITRNEEQVSKNNATLGNAGYLQHLTCQQVIKELLITLTVKCVPPENTSKRMVYSTQAMNVGLNLNWTIFDGFNITANYQRLKELERQDEQIPVLL